MQVALEWVLVATLQLVQLEGSTAAQAHLVVVAWDWA